VTSHEAEAHVQGDASVGASAAVSYTTAATLAGDAVVTATLTGLFGMLVDIAGDASVVAPSGLSRSAEAALVGDAEMTPGNPQYLFSLGLVGDSTVDSAAALAAVAAADVAGDADVGAEASVSLTVASSVTGGADTSAAATAAYEAAGALQGDAELDAAALGEFEMAADLAGDAEVTAPTVSAHAAVAAVMGDAVITGAPIVRPPQAEVSAVEAAEETPRLAGFQPGRAQVVKEPSFVVDPNPRRRER
jgi:hypothetical protein